MKQIIHKIPPFLISTIVILGVLYLTLMPNPIPGNKLLHFPNSDKVMHALMMAAVVGALAFDMYRFRHARKKYLSFLVMLVIVVSVILFGGVIEIVQGAMKLGRSRDLMDFIADAIGALVVYAAILFWISRRKAKAAGK